MRTPLGAILVGLLLLVWCVLAARGAGVGQRSTTPRGPASTPRWSHFSIPLARTRPETPPAPANEGPTAEELAARFGEGPWRPVIGLDGRLGHFKSCALLEDGRLVVAPRRAGRGPGSVHLVDARRRAMPGTELWGHDESFGEELAVGRGWVAVPERRIRLEEGAGLVHTFDVTDGRLEAAQVLVAPAGTSSFGSDIAGCGDRLLVSSGGDEVRLYRRESGSWRFQDGYPVEGVDVIALSSEGFLAGGIRYSGVEGLTNSVLTVGWGDVVRTWSVQDLCPDRTHWLGAAVDGPACAARYECSGSERRPLLRVADLRRLESATSPEDLFRTLPVPRADTWAFDGAHLVLLIESELVVLGVDDLVELTRWELPVESSYPSDVRIHVGPDRVVLHYEFYPWNGSPWPESIFVRERDW